MTDEEIIRREAHVFQHMLSCEPLYGREPVNDIYEIRLFLQNFYHPSHKTVFLDEIKKITIADNYLDIDYKETLLFYIRQELSELPIIARQKNVDNQERNKVFISYCHKDREYVDAIKKHFKPFQAGLNLWEDTEIKPGQKWKKEIEKAINQAKVAIILVSADFLASEFIANNELPQLISVAENEGAALLAVILKPCLFEDMEHLSQFQAMNAPTNPVISMNEVAREALYVNIVRQTRRILNNEGV